jgi:GNAT superfamily N-acetyltransferase
MGDALSVLTIRERLPADEPAVARLLAATADRVEEHDPRVRLARRPVPGAGALVAVDRDGLPRGHVRPVIEELAPDDEARQYAADRSASWTEVAADSRGAIDALAAALRREAAGAEADSVLWPAADPVAADWWTGVGLERNAHYCLRPLDPLPADPPEGVTLRTATPDDVDAVVALQLDGVTFQAAVSPYVRVVGGTAAGFTRRLLEGRSTTVLAEQDGEPVGVAEWWTSTVEPGGGAALLPPGRYAYLNSVGVRFESRGDGIGRALVSAALAAAAAQAREEGSGVLAGTTLWFSVHNPIASRVWPRLGWQPLWTLWERRALLPAAATG